jgi:hypothetical protein
MNSPTPRPRLEEPGDLWTIDMVSAWSGLSKSTLYEAARSGWLAPVVVRWGHSIRVPKAALRRLVEGTDESPGSDPVIPHRRQAPGDVEGNQLTGG